MGQKRRLGRSRPMSALIPDSDQNCDPPRWSKSAIRVIFALQKISEPFLPSDRCGALVSSHNTRESARVLRQRIATPDHVQIRPDENIVEAIDAPRCLAIDIERRERRADRAERSLQTRDIYFISTEPQKREPVGN